MNVCDTMKQLNSEKTDAFMHELYGNGAAENKARYEKVLKGFKEAFGDSKEVLIFPHQDVQRSVETTQTIIMEKYWLAALIWTV